MRPSVLSVYPLVLTFPLEISVAWRRSVNPVTVIFFLNRYLPFVWEIILAISLHIPACENNKWVFYSQAGIVLVTALSQAGERPSRSL